MIICSPQLGLSPKSVLGGEVFDRKILLELAKKNVLIKIILPKGKDHDKKIKNWQIVYLPISHFPAILGNFLYLPQILSTYKKSKFQILRLHQPQFFILAALFFKTFYPNTKIVATYHQYGESRFLMFSKTINGLWDHIICDSYSVARRISKDFGVPNSKITVVHNGVPNYLRPVKKNKRLLKKLNVEDKTILLFMGLFIERKNPLFLLDVLKKTLNINPDIILIFWGKGPLEEEIKSKAEKLGIVQNIRIIGPIYDREKNDVHNIADIFLHPSLDEGFALAPLESMACAKPIIMTKGYSAKECIIENINGYMCHRNNINEWLDKLSKLIKNKNLREKFGQESLKVVKKEFQWSIAAKKHFDAFNNLTYAN